ncbi:hypothetical protein [Pilimelia columellifera]
MPDRVHISLAHQGAAKWITDTTGIAPTRAGSATNVARASR